MKIKLNTIYCMDNIKGMKNMDSDSIGLTVTSPPYYNAKSYSSYSSVQCYMEQMEQVFSLVLDKTKKSRMCIVNISPVIVPRKSRNLQSYRVALPFYFVPMMEKMGWEFLDDIIWMKPDGAVPNRNAKFSANRKPISYKPNIITEYVLVFKKPAPFLIDKVVENRNLVGDGYERTNVWKINPETRSKHPAPFPEKLVENCIRYYSYEGDVVLDPFVGSGTTAKVAKDLGRLFIGFDTSQEYVNIARKRIGIGKDIS